MVESERFGWLNHRAVLAAVVLATVALGSSVALAGSVVDHRVKEAEYVASALEGKPVLRACVQVHVELPATAIGPAPAPLAAVLGIIRQPSAPPNTLTALNQKLLTGSYYDTYVNSVHFARPAFGLNWYVFVAGPPRFEAPLRNLARCKRAQALAFHRERPRIPRPLLPATQRMFRADLRSERRLDTAERRFFASPQVGADLGWLQDNAASLNGSWTAYESTNAVLEIVQNADSIATQGFIENVDTSNGRLTQSLVAGIVPDGVTTLTLRFSAGRRHIRPRTVKAHAVNNVFVAAVPDALAKRPYTVTLRWRATKGSTIHALP